MLTKAAEPFRPRQPPEKRARQHRKKSLVRPLPPHLLLEPPPPATAAQNLRHAAALLRTKIMRHRLCVTIATPITTMMRHRCRYRTPQMCLVPSHGSTATATAEVSWETASSGNSSKWDRRVSPVEVRTNAAIPTTICSTKVALRQQRQRLTIIIP